MSNPLSGHRKTLSLFVFFFTDSPVCLRPSHFILRTLHLSLLAPRDFLFSFPPFSKRILAGLTAPLSKPFSPLCCVNFISSSRKVAVALSKEVTDDIPSADFFLDQIPPLFFCSLLFFLLGTVAVFFATLFRLGDGSSFAPLFQSLSPFSDSKVFPLYIDFYCSCVFVPPMFLVFSQSFS